MPTRTEAIKRYLTAVTHADLANLYNKNMEVQIKVAQDGGERVDTKGLAYTDNTTTWYPIRIPKKAMTPEPEFDDKEMTYSLEHHAEGIGMTGWCFNPGCSKWVAFDFDAIVGHSEQHQKKLTQEELEHIKEILFSLDWVTIRRSTSGLGLHIYVYLDDVPTETHTEHAALARSILGMMCAITGFDFQSKVDACGGVMWVWHRKMKGTNGLELIKQGSVLHDVPSNWRDHVPVISGKSKRSHPSIIDEESIDPFEDLVSQHSRTKLDEEHQKLIAFLKETNAMWWWDQDHHMLITHTAHLQEAYNTLNLRGFFKTIATGKDFGVDHNCFCFPVRRGGWCVRRYTPGIQEHESWLQDGYGWTRCYLNREPDFITACKTYGGLEDPKGGFVFREAEIALKAASLLGVKTQIASPLLGRKTRLKQHKDGRLIVEIEHDAQDRADEMQGWLPEKDKWQRIFHVNNTQPFEPETGNFDDVIRHLINTQHEDAGWVIKANSVWQDEPLYHVKTALGSTGISPKDIPVILGNAIFNSWKLVNKPFQPEYPGGREWNRNAAQLRFVPSNDIDNLMFPTWQQILDHCGEGLNEAVKNDPWCRLNGIYTGADYLKYWIASLIQTPNKPLPYLFFYGPQNSGKTMFHVAIKQLFTKGYKFAHVALTSQGNFNAELEGSVLCIIEEIDLKRNKDAYNKIKDWVTSDEILIHPKGETPYHKQNSTHWIQCSNEHTSCPIFPGDTRITMCYVKQIDPINLIPSDRIIALLEKEAPDFLAELLHLTLPESGDRLSIRVINTDEKVSQQKANQTPLEMFIDEECIAMDGGLIKFSDFHETFIRWCDKNSFDSVSSIRLGRDLPPQFVKGRLSKFLEGDTGYFYIGNIYWKDQTPSKLHHKIFIKDGYLYEQNI